ncbi:hypothetical protein ONZ45_g6537 [Pleurotus djamor]|nr:hypothetical protein ONZ45_g6537 [Pleurotus djamor]
MPFLHFDVYVHILRYLPPSRVPHDDVSTQTLVACLQSSVLLNRAASMSSIWEAHYRTRYTHPPLPAILEPSFDWKLDYSERRRKDRRALRHLADLVAGSIQWENLRSIVPFNFDVWDAIELEAQYHAIDIVSMTTGSELPCTMKSSAYQYWAKGFLRTITRTHGTHLLAEVARHSPEVSFEESHNILSLFMGESPYTLAAQFGDLASLCRNYLKSASVDISNKMMTPALRNVCVHICRFMHAQGFGTVDPSLFSEILNNFPHAYLSTHKHTIPISLVHVFVSIATRLGLSAHPVNFPGIVIACVFNEQDGESIYVNVYGPSESAVLDVNEDHLVGWPLVLDGQPEISLSRLSRRNADMLIRASRNIYNSHRMHPVSQISSQSAMDTASFLAIALTGEPGLVHFLLQDGSSPHPLDTHVILPKLAELIRQPNTRQLLCSAYQLSQDLFSQMRTNIRSRVSFPHVRYSVGMFFLHKHHDYTACIVGWDPTCTASQQWIDRNGVSQLSRGKNQPFYRSIRLGDRNSGWSMMNRVTRTYERVLSISHPPLFLPPTMSRPVSVQPSYYRLPQVSRAQPAQHVPILTDDHERWYYDSTASNRIVLSLKSGIIKESGWAMDRLCRLGIKDQFRLDGVPGLLEALFEWAEWYPSTGLHDANDGIFAPDPSANQRRQCSLEALLVLKSACTVEVNAEILAAYPSTLPLISLIIDTLDERYDAHQEFVLYAIELLQAIGPKIVLSSVCRTRNPVPRLNQIIAQSHNRSIIINGFAALECVLCNPHNASQLNPTAPALDAAVLVLPLFQHDPELVAASVNYLFAHLSNVKMATSFLLRPDVSRILKLLVVLLLMDQEEETIQQDISGAVHTTPSTTIVTRNHALTKEELNSLLEMPEPQRCYEWSVFRIHKPTPSELIPNRMKTMFVTKADGELTQVEFWNLYKDIFMQYQDRFPLLVASDVIKNVNFVFPQAQAMVLQGPTPRFVVRGVDRRKDTVVSERFKCRWDRCQCQEPGFLSPSALYEHLLEHLKTVDASPCLWSKCTQESMPTPLLRAHILTHLASSQPPPKHPSQSETITLPSPSSPHPMAHPTSRPPPPPRQTVITYQVPRSDPSSTSLTALLCIRALFRASFSATEEAPRPDADHFGFPGVVEEIEQDGERESISGDVEQEAGRKGRKAFLGVRKLLEGVHLRDESLMSWITEMVDATLPVP